MFCPGSPGVYLLFIDDILRCTRTVFDDDPFVVIDVVKEGIEKKIKYIDGCELVYQCGIYGITELKRENLPPAVSGRYYPADDAPHTLYFGKILKAEKSR